MADLPEPISREEQYLDYIAKNLSGGGGGGGDVTYPITINKGGTSATTAENARTNLDVYSKGEVDTAVSLKANASDVYTTTQIDEKLLEKANIDDVYQKGDIDSKFDEKANVSDVYTTTQIDEKLGEKANASDVYTTEQIDSKLAEKANTADVYTTAQIDEKLGEKANTSDVYSKSDIDLKLEEKVNKNDEIVIIGKEATSTATHSVSLGYQSEATEENTVSVGNTTTKRRIVNVDTPVNDNDVATKAYVDSSSGGGGGGVSNVVQTTGDSETDVMSQKAVTDELNNKVNKNDVNVVIGELATCLETNSVAIGYNTKSKKEGTTTIGYNAIADNAYGVSIGYGSEAEGANSVALGYLAVASSANVVSVGGNIIKRRITNVDDPVDDNDAVTKKYSDSKTGLEKDVTYYVDNVNGSDEYLGTTKEAAFATLDYAMSKIPKIIHSYVTIYLLGDSTTEPYTLTNGLRNYSGSGSINIYGWKTGTSGNPVLNEFQISYNNLSQITIASVRYKNNGGTARTITNNLCILNFSSVEFYREQVMGAFPNCQYCNLVYMSSCSLTGGRPDGTLSNFYFLNLKASTPTTMAFSRGCTIRVLSDCTNSIFKSASNAGSILFDKSGQLVTQIGE